MSNEEERILNSNKEGLIIDKEYVNICHHLAINKKLIPISDDLLDIRIGFFKLINNRLQLHIKIPEKGGKSNWHWFYVVDATDEEKKLNMKLNIRDEQNKEE